ncbi:uncharacterized protein LOC143289436 [Babylonia areolata]|uniref:uncharacterized protein LOC143289436 n=1 Tax=Babylonia areolata TaxID=304850 RepID=UPI003FD193E6
MTSRTMRCGEEVTRSGSRAAAVSVEGALVLLLYLSLLSELLFVARGRYPGCRNRNSNRRFYRAAVHTSKRYSRPYPEKKRIRSLDTLWRRMQKATNQMRLVNLRHHVITKLMMEARMQARQRERERQQHKKVRHLAATS